MCLYVIPNTTRRVAQKDFFMYKWVLKGNNAPHQVHFKYEKNKTYKIGKQIRSRNGVVNEGFHGYITYNGAKTSGNSSSGRKLITLIVPKGTNYYVGSNNEIAAEVVKTIALDDISGNSVG